MALRAGDALRMAAGGLRERKTRTALTILGIVIGTAMIVALVASGQGQNASINEQLGGLGPTTLLVRSANVTLNFTTLDTEAINRLPHVEHSLLTVSGTGTASRAGQSVSASVIGIMPSDLNAIIKGITLQSGQSYTTTDITGIEIGNSVASPPTLQRPLANTGDLLTLSVVDRAGNIQTTVTHSYAIKGVAAPFGSAPYIDVDGTVFMAPQAAIALLKLPAGHYNQIIVLADSPDTVASVQASIQALYGINARVLSGTQIAKTVSGIFSTINTLLASIAGISLLVAGVGIANTMFVSVLERTTEIGTLKAIGFRARAVLSVFLLEAGMTGLIGGALGCLLGVGIAYGIGGFLSITPRGAGPPATSTLQGPTPFLPHNRPAGGPAPPTSAFGGPGGASGAFNAANGTHPLFTWQLFALAILFAILIATLAGYIPSRKAARLDPVMALKRT